MRLTLKEIVKTNKEASNKGQKFPYSKNIYLDVAKNKIHAMLMWNKWFRNNSYFTKKEYAKNKGITTKDLKMWNAHLPKQFQFKDQEMYNIINPKNRKRMTAIVILSKNKIAHEKGKPLPYTYYQHSMSKDLHAQEMMWWNYNFPFLTQYTQKEHSEAKKCTSDSRKLWNKYLPKAEQYIIK